MRAPFTALLLAATIICATSLAADRQTTSLDLRLTGDSGTPPRLAVPDLLIAAADSKAAEFGNALGEVLRSDLAFEREFFLIPKDTYDSIPAVGGLSQPPFAQWRALGADAILLGALEPAGSGFRVEIRLYGVRDGRQHFARVYDSSNPRLLAHTVADEIHQSQRNLLGVARTKLTFISDRDGAKLVNPIDARDFKEVYITDYDGANQRRVTVGRQLNANPSWSPDARAIAYTSWRKGFMDIFVSRIYEGALLNPTGGTAKAQNMLPMFSPDGTQIAFSSNRDGNWEIYISNVDGSDLRRVTNHPENDVSPTWSPAGTQIAFTSNRGGKPSIYIVGTNGLGLRRVTFEDSDRATWSPPPRNEIAYAAKRGSGYDIKVINLATNQTRPLTFGEGTNETPTWAPNGRHLAFWSTRTGQGQIFTVDVDGKNVRQITHQGTNQLPHWSR